MSVTPWWQALKLRPEIRDASGAIDDVQMSLFQAAYAPAGSKPLYADASYYGEITYPTGQLVDLLAKVAVRLGSDNYTSAPALRRLDQGMGGGKSHACIGTWHLAAHSQDFSRTDIGKKVFEAAAQIAGKPLPADLGNPHVVVLPCDNMTAGAPVEEHDGPARNLYERFLWRLFEKDYARYEHYKPFFSDKSKIGDALRSLNRPVLIIIDEILDYIGHSLDGAGKPDMTAQDMGFLRALLDVVNDVPHVAMLVVMIASEKDSLALSADGDRRRDDLQRLLERNGQTATVNENADFSAILRRRLFVQPPANEVVKATLNGFQSLMKAKGWDKVFTSAALPWTDAFSEEVQRTYPFHPQLMHMAEHEWANLAGFQKVRSTIRVFSATVYALMQRAESGDWVPPLIGPGDLPLSNANVRESIIGSGLISDTKTQANYRSIAQNDIVGLDDNSGAARMLDINRNDLFFGAANPRAAERAATMIFMASIVGSRGSGRRGASEPEVLAASAVPNLSYAYPHAGAVLKDLSDSDAGMGTVEVIPGKGGQPPRYFLSTTQTLTILLRAAKNTITDDDRDQIIARIVEDLTTTGGMFRAKRFIERDMTRSGLDVLVHAGIDDARTTRLVVLDPAQFSLRNGMEKDTLAAINAVVGIGENKLPAEWAASAIFAVVNTQRRQQTRGLAVNYLAHESALSAPEMAHNPDMKAAAVIARAEALSMLKAKVRSAYQHVVYLSQPEPTMPRTMLIETFDDDLRTALNGDDVWGLLTDKDRAFEKGQFTGTVLLLNLRDEDYGRPLSEVRDSFWSAPRLPLLPGGEEDLRRAIFGAVQSGELRLVDANDEDVTVTGPNEINLAQSGVRLAKPRPLEANEDDLSDNTLTDRSGSQGDSEETAKVTTSSNSPKGAATAPGTGTGGHTATAVEEKNVTFTVATGLNDNNTAEGLAQVFLRLYEAIDGGNASYAQGTMTLIVDGTIAEGLVEALKDVGITPNVKDQ
ncbi:DUF499 domain-containing protein [Paenarthrobacter nicotinovorans]|uniref:DUF499 domain-containing protein n=1 Tax=Paenarthrobacter nicotinovorans TaxID=29320 RepID=UPI002485506D|nr:DUF499 domain-containing protein [Paenarthrobacter nicotinovorans]MDI2019999.1 hypothetical protein [Paenarthrobacter nicotinovorans]